MMLSLSRITPPSPSGPYPLSHERFLAEFVRNLPRQICPSRRQQWWQECFPYRHLPGDVPRYNHLISSHGNTQRIALLAIAARPNVKAYLPCAERLVQSVPPVVRGLGRRMWRCWSCCLMPHLVRRLILKVRGDEFATSPNYAVLPH